MALNLFTRNVFDDIDVQAFRDNSRQLDEFMCGDFSSMSDEIGTAFPNAPTMPERYVMFAARVADEIATLYDKPPRREFAGVNRAQRDKLEEIYASSGFDEELKRAQMRLVLQQTMIVQVLPQTTRKYSLHHYAPHEAFVEPGQGGRWKDIEAAPLVELLWPVRTIDERVWYGILTITPEAAIITGGTGPVGLYEGFGMANPYGRIPLSVVRTVEPRRGRFFGPIAEDVLALNIALNLGASDRESMLHHQAWGQKVLETSGPDSMAPTPAMVEKMPVGHDRIMVIPTPNTTYKIVQGQPQVPAYISSDEHAVKMAAMMRDLSPSRFSKANTAQTGAARAADAADREQARQKYAKVFTRLEREMLATIAETSRIYGDPVPIPETARLDAIHYHAWEPPGDPQAAAQAHALTDATGETSAVTRVALKHNIAREAALDMMRRNVEEQSSINPTPPTTQELPTNDGNDEQPDGERDAA